MGEHSLDAQFCCNKSILDGKTCLCIHSFQALCTTGKCTLCPRLCTTWTFHIVGHLSVQEVHKLVCLKCKLPEGVHHLGTQVRKELKCPSGAQPCAQKCIPV